MKVTDHARVQYLKRIMKLDIEAIDKLILTACPDTCANGVHSFVFTHKVSVRDGRVTTVLAPNQH